MQLAEAEITGVVKRLLPRPSGRSQSLSRHTRCKSRGCTGNQRVRVLVVEKFEWQTSEGRIDGTCPAWRCKATRREQQQVPSQKEAEPSEETPDEGGRWREGEIGAQVSRDILKNFAMGFDCGLTSSQGLTRWKASWVLRTLILNRLGGNENPRSSDSNRGTRRKTGDPAADRAAWSRLGGVRRRQRESVRDVRGRRLVSVKAPTADKNRRRGSASAKGCR
jgi:hypothetical protein